MSRSARRITATVLASGALLAAAALPATADGRDHGRDRDRDHGHSRDAGRDHGRDRDRDQGRDRDRDQGHGRDDGRDHGRDQGHGRDDGRDHGHSKPAQRSAVVLGKIQYDSPGRANGSNRSLNGEWVTVTNTGRSPVNLRGWTLSDESRRVYRFDLRLAGRSSVRVHTGVGRDNSRDVYQDLRHYVWDESDTATLRDAHGHKVDSKSWGRHHHGGRR
ncbi:lamin tail domain-containing protein [Streptomyces brevispora]|uniref:lamin tail domain-containing protein n=1 Tax=Streptomyces brevispora TaxID=887462 RepID=UPI003711B4ED